MLHNVSNRKVFLQTPIILVAILTQFASGQLANSPWPMFQHDAQHTGRSPYAGPSTLIQRWQFRVEGTPSSPVIGEDGTIYLPTGMTDADPDTTGFLYAINPNGTLKWRYNLGRTPSSTTPAIAFDGTIYVHTNGAFDIYGEELLFAINPDGTLKWTFNFGSAFASVVQSSPAIGSDGTIYVGSMNMGFYAINPNGTIKWAHTLSNSSIQSSPAIGSDGTVYIVDVASELAAFNPDGSKKWQVSISEASGGRASPSIGTNGAILICNQYEKELRSLNSDSTLMWSHTLSFNPVCAPALGLDSTVYVCDDGLYAIKADSTLKWKFSNSQSASTSPVVDSNGTVYWRSSPTFYAVNPNGTQKYQLSVPSTGGGLDPAPAIGSDGTLYLSLPEPYSTEQCLKAYSDNPVPVELVCIVAQFVGNATVQLNWQTATEINNCGFEVERRSINGQSTVPDLQSQNSQWVRVGFIAGSGTSGSPHKYCFRDCNLVNGRYAYRLKQIDRDGSFKYHGNAVVEITAPAEFALAPNFPNPFNPRTTITFSLPSQLLVTLKVFDALGREVSTLVSEELPAGTHTRQWNAADLPSGIYFYRLHAGSFSDTKKLLLVK
jgi:outer membrane protein assembly factor BamB